LNQIQDWANWCREALKLFANKNKAHLTEIISSYKKAEDHKVPRDWLLF